MTDARTGTPAYYADYEIEPVDFIHANNIGFIEGNKDQVRLPLETKRRGR